MTKHKYDLTTQEALKKLGFSQTKLTKLVDDGYISRERKIKGKGWLYSSGQIDCYLKNPTKKCENDCKDIKVVSSTTIPTTNNTFYIAKPETKKKSWWKIWS